MRKRALKNLIVNISTNLILLMLGLIVPRIFLVHYGSDTNGLLGTLNQVFAYVALLEAGISQATLVQLYKPLATGNRDEISVVLTASRRYYRKITWFYGIAVAIISFLLPIVIKSELSYSTIMLSVLFEGAAGVVSFYFIQTQTILLNADGRNYINSIIALVGKVAGYAAKIVLALMGENIIFIQFAFFVISLSKMVFYKYYMNKHYQWIDYCNPDGKKMKLPNRGSFVITELAWTLFSSTDAIVLSIFCSTKLSSVYSVNNMAFVAINSLIASAYGGVSYLLGKTYNENIEKYKRLHDLFNVIFMSGITILMSVTILLFDGFIELYTMGVSDANYSYYWLPVLFASVQMLSWSRYVSGNLTSIAGYAKPVSYISLLEAIVNIVLSVALVIQFGIYGVVFATVAALPIKVIFTNCLSEKKILKRTASTTIKILIVNYVLLAIAVLVRSQVSIVVNSWLGFVIWGIVLVILCGIVVIAVNVLLNMKLIRYWVNPMLKKRR